MNEQTVKLMPGNKLPRSETVSTYGLNGKEDRSYYGSQLKPVELPADHPAVKLLRDKGWVEHEPIKVPTLEELGTITPDPVLMQAPLTEGKAVEVERENGDKVLYPGALGEPVEVDPQDVEAVSKRGWVPVLSGSSRPPTEGLKPGTRFIDEVSGQESIVDASGQWYTESEAA